jgi:hypothetical protein
MGSLTLRRKGGRCRQHETDRLERTGGCKTSCGARLNAWLESEPNRVSVNGVSRWRAFVSVSFAPTFEDEMRNGSRRVTVSVIDVM